jgi:two-component system, chemotaxis family, sensor kinase CheA
MEEIMSFQEDETLRLYVEESLEHLSNIENDLLAIESAGADINEDLVNKVFRAAHSIKGGAGFMGLDHIKELSHKMENVLGMIREREMVPNPEIVNILLLSSDTLRNLLKNVEESNNMDISEHVEALIGLTSNSMPAQDIKKSSDMTDLILEGKAIFNVSKKDIQNARNKGYFIYLIKLDLIRDLFEKDITPIDFIAKIQESGTLFNCTFDLEAAGTLQDSNIAEHVPFAILFGTILEPSMVNALFDIEEKNIYEVKEDFSLSSVDQSTSVESTGITPGKSEYSVRGPSENTQENKNYKSDEAMMHDFAGEQQSNEIKKQDGQAGAANADTSLRVHVKLLDSLMNLAGELVLGRNQLLQAIALKDLHSVDASGQRLDLITSELQEAIMMTRMQPIGNILNKFPRVVRDLARSLSKEVALTIEGESVELDKTILEAISDPLTHLVRNAVDHGIEMPANRNKAGKNTTGHIILKAYHEAGQVNVEIRDDGKGIDPKKLVASAMAKNLITEKQALTMSDKEKINLVFLPGLSTAEKVSDVSGRGVGMDVVKTNLDKLGGVVDIESKIGEGTIVKIKLPLTLAIIPSQLIKVQGERYAIPQVNLEELFRIPAAQVKDRIERVGDAEVVRLRDSLLPLIRLADIIGIDRTYNADGNEESHSDRRMRLADRRSKKSPLFREESSGDAASQIVVTNQANQASMDESDVSERRMDSERRYHATSAVNIVVVYTGALKYGLVVDQLQDSEEIVVKPLGRHIKHCKGYAGATIMGDGRVALILDVAGISQMAGLTSMEGTDRAKEIAAETRANQNKDIQALLVFRNAEEEQFAVPLGLVERIEKIKKSQIENVGGRRVIQYRGATLPLIAIEQVAQVKPLADKEDLLVIVFVLAGREIGLLATPPLDAIEKALSIDDSTFKQPGIMGSSIIDGRTTLIINIFGIVEAINPTWFEKREAVCLSEGKAATILYAEDSNFFRSQIKDYLLEDGYNVIDAEDGLIAWDLLQQHEKEIALVIADIEMPNLDGFGLTKKIRADKRFSHLPIIALTTMAGDEDIKKGKELGINDYQIKLDKEKLMNSVYEFLRKHMDKK